MLGITLLLVGLFGASGGAPVAASEADFLDELPVVLSVSRLSQSLNEAPAAVTVIDRDMIRASGFRDIPELLRLVPGFSVAYTGDNTWTAGYHGLADAYSRRFRVLVDGRSIYSPHYGTVYWTDLPLSVDDIERIEVVRGPNASVHGANAFVAVINIITRAAAQVPGEFVSMQAGEQEMRGLTVRHGGGDGALRYRLTASTQQRDRFGRDVVDKSAVSGDNGRYFEASKTHFVNGRMDWQLSPDSDAMLQFGLSQGEWGAGSRTAHPRSLLEPLEQDSRALYLHLAYHRVESERREWRIQAYHTQNRFDADTVAMLEHHYFTGTDVSPRAAANFTLAPGHVLRLGVSRAYRSPTFFEEAGNQVLLRETGALVDVYTVPSDGLAPERILSREIGYVGYLRPARLEFDVRLFRDKINDFIGQQKADYVTDPGSIISANEFKYQNLAAW